MATVNALSVALFNAAAGGYAAEMTANAAGFANAVGPILEKDVSTDALFVDHLLSNLGVTSSNDVYAQAKAAVAALVTTKGRAGAATDAIDFLKAQEGSTNAYATIAANFAAKVNAAAAFTAANSTERDITKLISGVTGVDTDAAAIAAATAAVEAAAATAAAAAAAKAAADLAAANAAAEAAATKAAADLAAANAAAEAAAAAAAAKAAADLAAANATITSLQNPVGATFALTTDTDVKIGVGKGDVFTGTTTATATVDAADVVVDATVGDGDTLTISGNAAPAALTSINIESVNYNLNALGALTVDATNLAGVTELTITRGDVVVGGSTLTGDKTVRVDGVDGSKIAKITVGTGTTTVDINGSSTKSAGTVVNADNAKTTVNVDGAATVNAANATGTVAIDAVSNTTSAQTAKATVINAAKAATVTTHADLTGSIEINAAKATTVTVNDAQGGAKIDAQADGATITVVDIDNSGATITAGTGTADVGINIVIDGTTASTDAATISAAGAIALDIDGTAAENVDVLTLSGNGAAVTYTIATPGTGTFTSVTKAGTQSVTLKGASSVFTAKVVSDIDVVNMTTAGAAIDASKFSGVGKIQINADIGANAITVADAQTVEVKINQTGLDFNYASGAKNVNFIVGDVNGTNTAVGTLTVGAFDAAASSTSVGNVTITAEESNLTATATVIGAKQTLILQGDEDYDLGGVTAAAVVANSATGSVTLTSAGNVKSVVTGSGNDAITANHDSVHVFTTNDGDDTITISDAAATSQFDGGAGDDSFTLTEVATAYVAVGGEGADTFTAGDDFDAVIVGGNGTDTLKLTADSDFTAGPRANFAWSSIEKLDLTGAVADIDVVLSAAQFANNSTFEINGTNTADTLTINAASTGSTINGSGITVKTGAAATISYVGSAKADSFTGGKAAENFTQTAGADYYDGGLGTDTITLAALTLTDEDSVGAVINLGTGTVSQSSVFSQIGTYTSVTSVAAGSIAYTFADADNSKTYSTATSTVVNIENVTGSGGSDYIVGSAGNNTLSGLAGADYILGGDGDDTIIGGDGIDKLSGGNGTDTFQITSALTADRDVISGFGATDIISFDESVFSSIDFANTAAVAGLNASDYNEVAATGTMAADKVNVVTTSAGYASYALAYAGFGAGGAKGGANEVFVVFYNSATSLTEVYFDADASADTGAVLVAQLDITGANLAAALSNANFGVF